MNLIKKANEKQYLQWVINQSNAESSKYVQDQIGLGFYEVKNSILHRIDWNQLNENSWVVVMNDYDLTLTREFLKHNITNIVFISTSPLMHEYYKRVYEQNKLLKYSLNSNFLNNLPWKKIVYLYNKTTTYINRNGKETNKKEWIFEGDSLMGINFDYIIANPPYGKSGTLGSKITRTVMDNVRFKKYINLLPSSGYAYNELYTNVSNYYGKVDGNSFKGALTDPCVVELVETKNTIPSFLDFEIEYVYDKRFEKFFREQQRREEVCLEHYCNVGNKDPRFANYTSADTFITTIFVTSDGVYKLREDSGENKWNLQNYQGAIPEVFISKRGDNQSLSLTRFPKDYKPHYAKWYYSAELNGRDYKSGLATKLFKALHTGTSRPYNICIPRVDWSHDWTDEEILRDYGYTEEEIRGILDEA